MNAASSSRGGPIGPGCVVADRATPQSERRPPPAGVEDGAPIESGSPVAASSEQSPATQRSLAGSDRESGLDIAAASDKDGCVETDGNEGRAGRTVAATTERSGLPKVASKKFWPLAYRIAFNAALHKAGGDIEVAEDAAQATMLEAHKRQDTLRDERGLKTWLRTTARNKVIDHYRKTGRDIPVDPQGSNDRHHDDRSQSLLDQAHAGQDPDDVAIDRVAQQELRSSVTEAIDMLPDQMAQMVRLFYLDDVPTSEIAERLGVSDGAVRTSLYRARQTLRRHFAVNLGQSGSS